MQQSLCLAADSQQPGLPEEGCSLPGSEQVDACLPALSCPAELAGALTLPFLPLPWWVGDLQRNKVGVHWNCNPNSRIT